MSFLFICPHCAQRMDCDDTLENQIAVCPSCSKEIVPVRELEEDNKKTKTPLPEAKLKIFTDILKKEIPLPGKTKSTEEKTVSGVSWIINTTTGASDSGEFKPPLLTSVLKLLGMLELAVGAVSILVSICMLAGGDGKGVGVFASAVLVLIGAVFMFGMAQFIEFVGKICFNSDKLVEMMKRREK